MNEAPPLRNVAAAIAAITVVASCGGGSTSDQLDSIDATGVVPATSQDGSSTPQPVEDLNGGVDGPVMFAPGPWRDEGDGALIEGVLARDGDCLYVGDAPVGSRFAVLWPFGTSWDESAESVVAPDGTVVPLGAVLSAGGGYGPPERLGSLAGGAELLERAEQCAEGEFREIASVQHSIRVIEAPAPYESDEGSDEVGAGLDVDDQLDGETFLAMPADGIDPAVEVTLSDGQLFYRSICNSLFGGYRIEGGVLFFESSGSTLVACDEPASMGLVGDFLASSPTVTSDDVGVLTLTGSAGSLTLRSNRTAEPVAPIFGDWRTSSVLLGLGAESSWMLASARVTLEPERIVIDGPCTDGKAVASFDGRRLVVTDVDFVPAACDEQGTEIEAALVDVFSGVEGRAEFDIVTTRSGIVLAPVDPGDPNEFVANGVRLVPDE